MVNKIDLILKQVLEKVNPPHEDLKLIDDSVKDFLEKFGKELQKGKVDAEIFVGGSVAKKTMIKKGVYDVDVFVRFDAKYDDKTKEELLEKLLKNFEHVSKVHGSRDYFRISVAPSFSIEIIPVKKIKNPKEADNITDLSYSHVKYVNSKVKGKILDDIKVAKAFCHANKCYGAESYINGFSGYGLELLIYHYGSFLKFVKEVAKHKKDKIVIDLEKDFKNKKEILLDLNGSKLLSPIILIDPTHKQRNVLAALSDETFEKFKKDCVEFLKNPSLKNFELEKIDFEKMRKTAKSDFVLLKVSTNKQEGDVAGTKLLKFYKHLQKEIEKFFDLKKAEFVYEHEQSAEFGFVGKAKKEILFNGPFLKDKKNVQKFKKEHKKTFEKKGKLYAKEKIDFGLEDFIKSWKRKNGKRMNEMYIESLEIIFI
ncbi:nucleotidyltransferase domain-containing protein [Candidatus Pacearchaeota archaeon]|nr:nucleotidyltransferase domain-containing protein [Candidatus Pacearchaeota archaeon]